MYIVKPHKIENLESPAGHQFDQRAVIRGFENAPGKNSKRARRLSERYQEK